MIQTTEPNDAALVAESLHGSRDAFGRIVERYQNLICSLAYCSTGNVSQSEDVAQETFMAAWKDLHLLREPSKLRAWLCGIVRGRIQKNLRRECREPVHNAATLETVQDAPAVESLPSEQTISQEEEAILWRSLERIPQLYRDPLILFYREHQSIERVAAALELSEDAVKQRLSRGRKLLQEEVHAFVEGALGRTTPSRAFSAAVIAALPLAAGPGVASGLTVGTKSAAAAKSGFLAVWLAPFIGFFAGFASQWIAIRATTPERERQAKYLRLVVTWICLLGLPIVGESAVQSAGEHFGWSTQARFVSRAGFWCLWGMALAAWFVVLFRRQIAADALSLAPAKKLSPLVTACIAVGLHLTIFGWLISLMWRVNDRPAALLTGGLMVVMGLWACVQRSEGIQAEATRAAFRQMTLCSAAVVLIVNLRLDVWMAAASGVSVAEIHGSQPIWIVPSLTAALILWIIGLLYVTRANTQNTNVSIE